MTAEQWNRLKATFNQALEIPSHDRERFLTEIAAQDPELGKDVRRLIQNNDQASSFLRQPISQIAPQGQEESRPEHVLKSGQLIAKRFEIVAFLGAGGMGEVYQATDFEVGQQVAIKTLKSHLSSDPSIISQLKTELQLARRISHPNICRLFDLTRCEGPDHNEIVFLTMELLRGRTLSEILRVRRYTPTEVAQIVEQLLDGLSAAHHAGVIHRDLKSGNVIIVEGPQGDRAVITDFGLARETKSTFESAMITHGAGAVVGTPAYMAPEQLEGSPATPASDFHALGVVMFEMLTGRLPFEGATPLAIALNRLRGKAPSVRDLVKDLDVSWDRTIAACLEKESKARPQSSQEVRALLQGSARRMNRRQLFAWGLPLTITTAIAAILARPTHPMNAEAVRHFKLAEEFVKRRAPQDLINAIDEYQKAVALEPNFAAALAGLADAYSASGNFGFDDANRSRQLARSAAERALKIDPRIAKAQGALGYTILMDLKQWRKSEPYLRRAVELDPRDPQVRLWYSAYLGKSGATAPAIQQIKAGLDRDPASFLLNLQLAQYLLVARRDAEFFLQAEDLVRLHPYDSGAHLMRARSLEIQQRYDDALRSCDEVEKFGNAIVADSQRAIIEAARGDLIRARTLLASLEAAWRRHPFDTSLLAGALARIGEGDRALDFLFEAYELNDSSILTFVHTRNADHLRANPRFQELLRKLGLDPDS